MSATAKLLGCSVALGLTLSVSFVQASPPWVASGTHLSWVVLGQSAPGAGTLSRILGKDPGGPPPTDPYGGRSTSADPSSATNGQRPAPAAAYGYPPKQNGVNNAQSAFPLARGTGQPPNRSAELLLGARQALAKGDIPKAALLVGQAQSLGLDYPLHADSPQKLDALIQKAKVYAQGPSQGSDATVYTREFAQFLLDQATGLLGYQDVEGARQLAQQAKDLRAQFGQFDRTPDQVLAQVAAVRGASTPGDGRLTDTHASQNLSDATSPQRMQDPAGTDKKAQAMRLIAEARVALDRGDLATAQRNAEVAQTLVPDSAYGANETRPWEVLLEVNKAMNRRQGVMPAGHYQTQQAVAGGSESGGSYPVSQGVYDPGSDPSRNVAAQTLQPTLARPDTPVQASPGDKLFQDGLRALEDHDRATAMQYFRDAWKYERDLDPATRQQLQDKLMLLQGNASPTATGAAQASPLEAVDAKQQLLRQKMFREITSEQAEAQRLSASDPKGALARLESLRQRVSESEIEPGSKKTFLTMVDRNIDSLEQYIQMKKADIELAEHNQEVLQSVELDGQRRQEVHNKLASLVEEFNGLLDERRYAEAEMIAKQAKELAPQEAVVQNMMWQSRFVRRIREQESIETNKEQGFYDTATSVLESSAPYDDRNPLTFAEAKHWGEISDFRRRMLERQTQRLTEAELEIQKAMSNKVDVTFNERPLAEVLDVLSELSGVPIVLDPVGMGVEGVTSDTPVTIRLNQQISLRSALDLILAPLRLSHVIQSEVLRVTSEQTRDSNTYHKVYGVADLVIPIPNFVPGYNVGLAGAIQYAHNSLGYGNYMSPMGHAPLAVAANGAGGANHDASVLAQMGASGAFPSLSSQQPASPMGFGPGGMGGAAMADFDTLIELITSTIAPDSWDEVGGAGAIEAFPVNLSLVISQTQEVHEQIADLLDQLRRLQDLQVTIEVRFITLNDNFFERIGIDFDFSIDDNVNVDTIRGSERTGGQGDDNGPTVAFGLTESGPTRTLDLEFTQGGFGAALPQFGNFDPATAANFGFAILSDIEVFFLLQASEGDQRSNVLQAPKVTMFNGQNASVMDLTQRPFVTSIIPVVGDFAAAQQPVIVVLSEGTQLNVQAVVSSDRRFVRLTLVPFFSRIGPVEEFTFEGTETTDTGTGVNDPAGEETGRNNQTVSRSGTTVQLPTFIFTTVTTTVSVPDGGTVLLGGIKRLSEGRSERGVPMLSKLPYVNRLFKNVGIGRETSSLMMMVTPRIIIQEEEELQQTGYDSSN